MRNFLTILFLILSNFSYSQDNDLPTMKRYQMSQNYWPDTILKNQKVYWKNGNVEVEYLKGVNGIRIKKEYFPEGRIKLIAEIRQEYVKHRIAIMDTMGNLTDTIYSGYYDVPVGSYIEYHEPSYSETDIPLTTGQYLDGKMFGKWQTRVGALGKLLLATYNAKGELEGEYEEYYDQYKKNQIKWKGQFGMVKLSSTVIESETGKLINKDITRNERIGIWTQYDLGGKVISTVTYDWEK